MRYATFDWYEDCLYYDIVFDSDTEGEAEFLEILRDRHGRSRGRRALEPACGSGRLVAALAEREWRVRGFDLSEGMLRFARRRLRDRGLRASLARADMSAFTTRERFDLAYCLVSTFKHLADEASARGHLECVARALAPGGVYVLGLHLTDYDDRRRQRERWVAERDGIAVTCNIQSWPPDRRRRTERVRARMIVREQGLERGLETTWSFRTYSLRQLRSLLASVPALEHVATYGFDHDADRPVDLDGRQSDVVLVLRRRFDAE